MRVSNKFKIILSFMLIILVLFSFSVYAAATWIQLWGYCDGSLCPSDPVFHKICNSVTTCSRTYAPSNFCEYEGNYYFDGQAGTSSGYAEASPFFAFNIDWDADSNDCSCKVGAGKWNIGGEVMSASNKCCGDDVSSEFKKTRVAGTDSTYTSSDTDDACCAVADRCVYSSTCYALGATLGSIPNKNYCDGGTWKGGDVGSTICTVIAGEGRWNRIIGVAPGECCGDDLNEIAKPGYDDVCFASVNDCYSYLHARYLKNRESVGDMFCENGKLVSKTRIIALQLLSLSEQKSPEDYTLFCDSYQNTLNYYDYDVNTLPVENEYLSEVNNICVLRLPNQVIFGVSLKNPIYNSNFINVLPGIDNCNDAVIGDGQFHPCKDGNFKAHYNNATQGIIYSNSDILDMPNVNFWNSFLLFLRNPFQSIFNLILRLFPPSAMGGDYSFINSTDKFSRIYLSRKNTKSITGITEEVIGKEYLAINYSGFNENICLTVEGVKLKIIGQGQKGMRDLIFCESNPTTKTYNVATNNSMGLALWPDLTSKLRP
jgi:hypothetical protein